MKWNILNYQILFIDRFHRNNLYFACRIIHLVWNLYLQKNNISTYIKFCYCKWFENITSNNLLMVNLYFLFYLHIILQMIFNIANLHVAFDFVHHLSCWLQHFHRQHPNQNLLDALLEVGCSWDLLVRHQIVSIKWINNFNVGMVNRLV